MAVVRTEIITDLFETVFMCKKFDAMCFEKFYVALTFNAIMVHVVYIEQLMISQTIACSLFSVHLPPESWYGVSWMFTRRRFLHVLKWINPASISRHFMTLWYKCTTSYLRNIAISILAESIGLQSLMITEVFVITACVESGIFVKVLTYQYPTRIKSWRWLLSRATMNWLNDFFTIFANWTKYLPSHTLVFMTHFV